LRARIECSELQRPQQLYFGGSTNEMNRCKQCGVELSKKQYGGSLREISMHAPTGFRWGKRKKDGESYFEKGPGSITWAAARGPLCQACLDRWLLGPKD
jgi:hypothetical protein